MPPLLGLERRPVDLAEVRAPQLPVAHLHLRPLRLFQLAGRRVEVPRTSRSTTAAATSGSRVRSLCATGAYRQGPREVRRWQPGRCRRHCE